MRLEQYFHSVTLFQLFGFVVIVMTTMVIVTMIIMVILAVMYSKFSKGCFIQFTNSWHIVYWLIKSLVTVPPKGKVFVVAGLLIATINQVFLIVEFTHKRMAIELGQANKCSCEVLKE